MGENKLLFLFMLNVVDQTTVSVLGRCHPGFIGQNCNNSCRYPSYGEDCQNHCNCNEMYCDFKTGWSTLSPKSSTTKTEVDLVDETRGCPLGYTGNRCELPCRYPGFGKDCQSVCNCPEKLCNHVRGCNDGSPTLKPKSSTTKTEVSLVDETSGPDEVCPLGYIGNRCEIPCRYPSFGKDCQLDCNCTEKLCNHITGCHDSSVICSSGKESSHGVMIYSIVIGVLLLLTIVQFSVYFYLLYCFRTGRIFLTFSFLE